MSDNGNEKENGNEYWKEEITRLKEELRGLKKEMRGGRRRARVSRPTSPPRPPRAPRPPHPPNFEFDFDKSLGNYLESVLGSVAEGLDSAFRGVFHTKRSSRQRRGRRFGSTTFTEDQETEFYEKAPALVGLLADSNRLKLMKRLESGPKYQSDLVDDKLQGGTFKHHMSKLMDAGWVIQEKARGRYLIAISGREALKFAEFLFARSYPELFARTADEDEEKKPVDKKVRLKVEYDDEEDELNVDIGADDDGDEDDDYEVIEG
ncbi:MAG: ArsR/SmtB family transcription factor [Candidatus Hodarchaeales archaeon]|jgi:hypothetical protein